MFTNKTILGNKFHFKDRISRDLTSGVVYKFQFGLCYEPYCDEWVKHLNIRVGEHIGISRLTAKQIKRKNSSVADHLTFCNHSRPYGDFKNLTLENKMFLLGVKGSLLIMRDKPSLNRNITSTPLHVFNRP